MLKNDELEEIVCKLFFQQTMMNFTTSFPDYFQRDATITHTVFLLDSLFQYKEDFQKRITKTTEELFNLGFLKEGVVEIETKLNALTYYYGLNDKILDSLKETIFKKMTSFQDSFKNEDSKPIIKIKNYDFSMAIRNSFRSRGDYLRFQKSFLDKYFDLRVSLIWGAEIADGPDTNMDYVLLLERTILENYYTFLEENSEFIFNWDKYTPTNL